MCEVSKTCPELQMAAEDIKVYKCVHIYHRSGLFGLFEYEVVKSLVMDFEYKPNKVYISELTPPKLKRNWRFFDLYTSDSGFYSYKNANECTNAEFIIPKGSEYYLYNNSVYVSSHIKFVKLL